MLGRNRTTQAPSSGQASPAGQPAQVSPARQDAYDRAAGEREAYAPTAGERAATAAAGGGLMLTRLVRLIVGVIAAIIVLSVLFIVLGASSSNTIVSHINDWARWLTTPFRDIFSFHSHKATVAVNYGIAIVVYLIVAALVEQLIRVLFAPVRRRAVA